MKFQHIALALPGLFVTLIAFGQPTKTSGTYEWSDPAGWQTGVAPQKNGVVNVNIRNTIQSNDELDLLNSSLTISPGGMLYVNEEDFRFTANGGRATLTVNNGGFLVIDGDADFERRNNQLIIQNDGVVVVSGQTNAMTNGRGGFSVSGTGQQYFYNTPRYNGTQVPSGTAGFNYGDANDLRRDYPDIAAMIDGSANPLPVVLSSYTAQAEGDASLVQWVTESELNFSHFVLEHSLDGIHFSVLAEITAKGAENKGASYQYRHPIHQAGMHYYRLLAVDHDGTVEDHGMQVVQFAGIAGRRVLQNPVQHQQLKLSTYGLSVNAKVALINTDGRAIYSGPIGNGQLNISAKPGYYVLNIQDEGRQEQHRIAIF